jgi:hypothetical protein
MDGTGISIQPQEAGMERNRFALLFLVVWMSAVAGCQSLNAHNPLSRSHGLPPQFEGKADEL